jgi:hypothetical protein
MTCIRCGYDLRTLDVHGRCPECGCPIPETIRARRAQRRWRRSDWRYVYIGAWTIWVVAVGGFLAVVRPTKNAVGDWAVILFMGLMFGEIGVAGVGLVAGLIPNELARTRGRLILFGATRALFYTWFVGAPLLAIIVGDRDTKQTAAKQLIRSLLWLAFCAAGFTGLRALWVARRRRQSGSANSNGTAKQS